MVLLSTVDKLDKNALVLIKRIWRHFQIHGLSTEVLKLSLLVRHLLDVTSVEFEKVREQGLRTDIIFTGAINIFIFCFDAVSELSCNNF